MKKKTSKYRGCSWDKFIHKWRVDVSLDGKTVYIGVYKTEIQAAKAYNKAAKIVYGKKATLNKV